MNTLVNVCEEKRIENMIYEIRGKQVMLDSDLARLYRVETKRINEAVRRNNEKFPERFSWVLSDIERNNLWSQNATANMSKMSRTNPRVFTEQGVAMLATILKSNVAVKTSISIMDAFVAMRHYIGRNDLRISNVESKIIDHDERIKYIENAFSRFEKNKAVNDIYFDGQIFDAYYKIREIFSEAKKNLIIIDSYADIILLNIIKDLKVGITLIATNKLLKKPE